MIVQSAAETIIANPNSAEVWHYTGTDLNGNGEIDWEEEMHRSIGTPAIKDGVLYIADFSGLFHCLDARTGQAYWTYDLFAQCWGSALIADGKVYIADEDGDVAIFRHSGDPQIAMKRGTEDHPLPHSGEINMGNSTYSTPIVANGVLYIATKSTLFAIAADSGTGD